MTESAKGNAPGCRSPEALSEVSQAIKKGTIVANSTALTIGGTAVRQTGGLYSLNDLHRAAGGEDKHQPAFFMRREETQALVQEISKSADSQNCAPARSVRGKFGGTYACKELVIAYAAWISAAFHLKVIRVFLASAAPKVAHPVVVPALTNCGDKNKVSKLLAVARKQAEQRLARIDKELADWDLVDDGSDGAMPVHQAREIDSRLERLGRLFHPASEQFRDVLGLSRALRGLDPKMSARKPGWVEVLPKITA